MAEANTNPIILEAENLSKIFRGLHALEGYRLQLPQRQILGVIGPNGAGKTTLFNVMSGNLDPTTGKVIFQGRDITGARPDTIAKLGMARTFQTIRLFNDLTVLENAKTARQLHHPTSFIETLFSLPSFRKNEKEIAEKSLELLDLFHLYKYRDTLARNLPYGDQRRLEIVRALCTEPKVLMLDEPAAGMNPAETNDLHGLILDIRDRFDLTIILVEHDMKLIMQLCERIQVLNYGKIICEGTPDEVRNTPQVIEAYLGRQRGTDA